MTIFVQRNHKNYSVPGTSDPYIQGKSFNISTSFKEGYVYNNSRCFLFGLFWHHYKSSIGKIIQRFFFFFYTNTREDFFFHKKETLSIFCC